MNDVWDAGCHWEMNAWVQACIWHYEKTLREYSVGNRYVGTFSMVDLNSVFVSLDGGIDCLCTYPPQSLFKIF